MITQKCPKCGSSRIRRGYRPTSVLSKLVFRYNLLCDTCNWEFTGFAIPIKTDTPESKKQDKVYSVSGKPGEIEPTESAFAEPGDQGIPNGIEGIGPVIEGAEIRGEQDERSSATPKDAGSRTAVRSRSGGVAKKTAVRNRSGAGVKKTGPGSDGRIRPRKSRPRTSKSAATSPVDIQAEVVVTENGTPRKAVAKTPVKKRPKPANPKATRKKAPKKR